MNDRRYSIIARLGIVCLWALSSKLVSNEIMIPTIGGTLVNLIDIVTDSSFPMIIRSTLLRGLAGFLISLSLAIILGIAANISRLIYNFMMPILNFLKSVPTMAIIILALIWLSNSNAPMFVGFIMVFPILYETVLNGILNIDSKITDMAQLYKVGSITLIRDIYIPSVIMNLKTVLTSTLGLNFKMVIAGEVLSQPTYAIGSNLQLQKLYLNTPGVFAWIIIIIILINVLEWGIESAMKILKIRRQWK